MLCPGFVNTHCHLELSWAWGKIQQHKGLDHFIRSLEALKSTILPEQQLQAIENEGDKMLSSGIVAVADISNTSLTGVYKQKAQAYFHTFVELYGSDPDNAEMSFIKGKELLSCFTHAEAGCSASLTPHSTYSVSADLFQLIAENQLDSPVSIHHMETADELDFFKTATGSIAERRNLFNLHLQPLAASGKRPMEAIAPYFVRTNRF
jgi:cytosine/adenosine deaminase-related metal-dependent hydrolase